MTHKRRVVCNVVVIAGCIVLKRDLMRLRGGVMAVWPLLAYLLHQLFDPLRLGKVLSDLGRLILVLQVFQKFVIDFGNYVFVRFPFWGFC